MNAVSTPPAPAPANAKPHWLLGRGAGDDAAVIFDGGDVLTWRMLHEAGARQAAMLGPARSLVVIEVDNSPACVTQIVGTLAAGHAALLVASDAPDAGERAATELRAGWHWRPSPAGGTLTRRPGEPAPLHADLALLLATSGSTGAGKYVRLSDGNLASNARAIGQYLGIEPTDRGLLALPLQYSYGLSILTSHLCAGAAVLVSTRSFVEPELWHFFDAQQGTSIAGVPHSWSLLDRRFDGLGLHRLRVMTQAGGRMAPDDVQRWAARAEARGARFFVMYGQTEASPRIAYVPPALLAQHPDCIGVPVPGGRMWLADEEGREILAADTDGELVYEGPNVMMGYALTADDLAAPAGPAQLKTGDLARRNEAGLYRITGRMSRFLKLFGLRIALDEIERRLEAQGLAALCTGDDRRLAVVSVPGPSAAALRAQVAAMASLPPHAVQVVHVDALPRLASGKPDLQRARALADAAWGAADAAPAGPPATAQPPDERSVRAVYAALFPSQDVDADSTFHSLGGDSLTYVEATLELERCLGRLPDDWPEMTVRQLQALVPAVASRRGWMTLEVPIALRALAMGTIVSNHFGWFVWPGGAFFLMMLAGWGFARFSLPAVAQARSIRPLAVLLAGIAVPTLLSLWLRSIKTGQWNWLEGTLLGNWVTPQARYTPLYWFIEVLCQLLLVAIVLLAIPRVRAAVLAHRLAAPLGVLAAGVALALGMPSIWDASALNQWVPHMLLWMFALGWLIHASRTVGEKVTATLLAIALPVLIGGDGGMSRDVGWIAWFCAGSVAVLWAPALRLPSWMAIPVHQVAAASLFIYLFHFDVRRWVDRLGLDLPAAVLVAGGIGFGVLMWAGWSRLLDRTVRRTARDRAAARKASHIGGDPAH